MDILSHGLYGGVAFGRQSKNSYWTAFGFGILPDLFAFGLPISHFFFSMLSGESVDFTRTPDEGYRDIPAYVFQLYDLSHSLVVFLAVFLVVWAIRRRVWWEMFAWPLHILVDIFTHSERFFPTPFLWPISDFTVNGRQWGSPEIYIPNLIILASLYWYWWYRSRKTT